MLVEQISTRRLRVLKYRGTARGTNEYPFLIGARGMSVLPGTLLTLDRQACAKSVPTGVARLDEMPGGKGVYRGGCALVPGSPGRGKSRITFGNRRQAIGAALRRARHTGRVRSSDF